MKKNKIAFSVPEILITMGIVGVISVLGLTIIKPSERALVFQYSNAYNTLKTAAYNVYQESVDANFSTDTSFNELEKRFANTAEELCQKLAINPKNSEIDYTSATEYKTRLGFINTVKYNCDGYTGISGETAMAHLYKLESSSDKLKLNLAFQASNSMLYYLSEPFEMTLKNFLADVPPSIKKTFFLAAVDINGPRNPNTHVWKRTKPSDIVFFLISNSGQVIPVGHPAVDRRYMSASVKHIDGTLEKYLPGTYTYLDAARIVFNDRTYPTLVPDSIILNLTFGTIGLPNISNVNIETAPELIKEKCEVSAPTAPPLCLLEVDSHSRNGF